ncbi:hypothetical protein [Amycolatopsis pittospori]|uniref:hypothetical protein n=1 Tax=Amycolatopsis pittospori TaxID=2749434 RepID=UPI0015F010A9|nr:hypothetical protein [Amycolatopsis pittospori]
MIDSKIVVESLTVHGMVGWYRISVGRDKLSGLINPPLVVWRYVEPDERVKSKLRSCVEEFSGNVKWSMNLNGVNWTLMPVVLQDEFDNADPTYVDVVADLAHADQEFCKLANEDLVDLLENIRKI